MTDKEKILKYLDYKGISKNKFYQKTGFSVGFLDSGSSLGVDKLRIIIDNYHDLNPEWFLTDKGEMLKKTYQFEEHSDDVTLSDTAIPYIKGTPQTPDINDYIKELEKELRHSENLRKIEEKQNDLLREQTSNLVGQANDLLARYNKLSENYNKLSENYNRLAEQLDNRQAG